MKSSSIIKALESRMFSAANSRSKKIAPNLTAQEARTARAKMDPCATGGAGRAVAGRESCDDAEGWDGNRRRR